jgi:hypothetical protein
LVPKEDVQQGGNLAVPRRLAGLKTGHVWPVDGYELIPGAAKLKI